MFNAFFNSTCLSDVKFCVDGKIVPAHKLLLAAKSPVFNAMFCGELAEQEQINLPDCDYEGILEFLRFLERHERNASFVSGRKVHSSPPHQEMQQFSEFKLGHFKCVFRDKACRFLLK